METETKDLSTIAQANGDGADEEVTEFEADQPIPTPLKVC